MDQLATTFHWQLTTTTPPICLQVVPRLHGLRLNFPILTTINHICLSVLPVGIP